MTLEKKMAEIDSALRLITKLAASNCTQYDESWRKVNDIIRIAEEKLAIDMQDHPAPAEFFKNPYHHTPAREVYRLPNEARAFVGALIECKELPPRSQTRIQRLYKKVNSTRRIKGYYKWYGKIREDLIWALSSKNWPTLSESESEIPIGNMTLINQTDQDPAASIKTVQIASNLYKSSGIAGLSKSLYGNVFLVSSIANKKTTMAWYNPNTDQIYVIARKRWSNQQEHTVLHELGHRFWRKFAGNDRKEEWISHHRTISGKVELGVGDLVPTTKYTITKIEYKTTHLIDEKGEAAYLPTKKLEQLQRELKYPTLYSAQNYEEHFCEALGLFLQNELKPPHLEAFERVWT